MYFAFRCGLAPCYRQRTLCDIVLRMLRVVRRKVYGGEHVSRIKCIRLQQGTWNARHMWEDSAVYMIRIIGLLWLEPQTLHARSHASNLAVDLLRGVLKRGNYHVMTWCINLRTHPKTVQGELYLTGSLGSGSHVARDHCGEWPFIGGLCGPRV